jgi:hypothetical protein
MLVLSNAEGPPFGWAWSLTYFWKTQSLSPVEGGLG